MSLTTGSDGPTVVVDTLSPSPSPVGTVTGTPVPGPLRPPTGTAPHRPVGFPPAGRGAPQPSHPPAARPPVPPGFPPARFPPMPAAGLPEFPRLPEFPGMMGMPALSGTPGTPGGGRKRKSSAGSIVALVLGCLTVCVAGVLGLIWVLVHSAIDGVEQQQRAARAAPLDAAAAERLVDRVSPSIVDIDTKTGPGHYGAGTGIVLDAGGLIMTNDHVVAGAQLIQVTTVSDGKAYRGEVVGVDQAHDVAVVRMIGASGLPVAHFGDSDALQVGQQVAGIGNAGGAGGRPGVGTGAITGLHRSIIASGEDGSDPHRLDDLIEAMNGIRPGDSGGALVNTDGVVVGMNVAGGFNRVTNGPNGSGEAIPINAALRYAHLIVDRANGVLVPGPAR